MKINAHWQRHVEAWRESGLSQAIIVASKVSILKPFRVARRALPIDKNTRSMSFPFKWRHRRRPLPSKQAQ